MSMQFGHAVMNYYAITERKANLLMLNGTSAREAGCDALGNAH